MNNNAAPAAPHPAPLIDADSIGFWEAIREGRIALCRCTACGNWLGRPLERCNVCAGPTEFADVVGTGTIYTFIVVHRPVIAAFASMVPYVVAVVDFDEGPRLPGIVLDERGSGLTIGQRVKAELMDVPGAAERAIAFRVIDGQPAESEMS